MSMPYEATLSGGAVLNSHTQHTSSGEKIGILVLGPTGAGKSSFIATVTGSPVLIGHNITSGKTSKLPPLPKYQYDVETKNCHAWNWEFCQNQHVDLIDTPGFDDTIRPGMEVLSEIVEFLILHKHRIAGVIYLHPIQERRLTGTSRLNLNLLQAICGEHFYSHVTIVSTMWNTLPAGSPTIDAERRELALNEGDNPIVWRDMADKGSDYARYTGAYDSSRAIVQTLLSKHRAPHLKLSLELRDPRCALGDTSAGLLLTAEVRLREERLRREIEEEEEEARGLQAEIQQTKRLVARVQSGGNEESRRDRQIQRGGVERSLFRR